MSLSEMIRIPACIARQIVFVCACLTVAVCAAYAANKTYVNSRFGTTITYPDAIFTKAAPPSENGDGARWFAPDSAELAVWGQNNVQDFTPLTLADFIEKRFKSVTFRKVGARWMVVSGFDGDVIVYHRAEFGSQGVIHSMELRYPATLASHYNSLAGRIADSLIGP